MEPESVGLAFSYPTGGSSADARSLSAPHTVSLGTLARGRPGEWGPQETSGLSLSKKLMEQVYCLPGFERGKGPYLVLLLPFFQSCDAVTLMPSTLYTLGRSSALMALDTLSPLRALSPTREGHSLSRLPLYPQANLPQMLNRYWLTDT